MAPPLSFKFPPSICNRVNTGLLGTTQKRSRPSRDGTLSFQSRGTTLIALRIEPLNKDTTMPRYF